jgi:hypothetical protein
VQFDAANRQISNQERFTMDGKIINPDVSLQPVTDLTNYKLQWSCINIITTAPCEDRIGILIPMNQTELT